MDKAEEAAACFVDGLLCSQAVFATYAPALGLDRAVAVRIACGFGAGMGGLGETCGAASGAFMVIGLKHGSLANWLVDDRENAKKANTYRLVREFTDRFTARHGSLRCKDILGCDLSTPQGRQAAQARNLFRTVCPGLVRDAARILEEIL